MISRSFIIAGVFFLIYSLVLQSNWVRDHLLTQSQWQGNLIRAQEYPFAPQAGKNVVVGSSLMARLEPTSLSDDFYSLAFSGGGPLTGLEIVARSPNHPKLVLIETNLLMEDISQTMLSNVYRPVFAHLRPHIPAFRERFQPANVVVGSALERATQYGLAALRRVAPNSANVETGGGGSNDTFFQNLLAEQRHNMSKPPDSTKLGQRLEQLKSRVSELARAGTKVVFVEMPVDASLMELPYLATLREKMARTFPETPFIRPVPGHTYRTDDALHLSRQDAIDYASYLRGELARLHILP